MSSLAVASQQVVPDRRQRLLVLGICSISLLIVGLDVTIVNIALPAIRSSFHSTLSRLQWTVDAYTLVLASLLMLSGSTADRLGRRRVHRVAAADHQDPAGANARSVRVELQADCLAGIWKHSSYERGELTAKDFQEALDAAAVVGDDFQQHSASGTISPHDWTHGSSAQRQHWLTVGFEEGRPAACDTFTSGP